MYTDTDTDRETNCPSGWDIYETLIEYAAMTVRRTREGRITLLNRETPKTVEEFCEINEHRTDPRRAVRVRANGADVEPTFTREEIEEALDVLVDSFSFKSYEKDGQRLYEMRGMSVDDAMYNTFCACCNRRIDKSSDSAKMKKSGVVIWVHKTCKPEYLIRTSHEGRFDTGYA